MNALAQLQLGNRHISNLPQLAQMQAAAADGSFCAKPVPAEIVEPVTGANDNVCSFERNDPCAAAEV